MHSSYYIPSQLSGFQSILGRWLNRFSGDRLRAESNYILITSGLVLFVFAVNFVGWSWLREDILADPVGATAIKYYCVQIFLVVGLLALSAIGYSKAIVIGWGPRFRGRRSVNEAPIRIETSEIERIESVSADYYHRYYSRYAGVLPYINAVPQSILLIQTPVSILALGLSEPDNSDLYAHLDRFLVENTLDTRLRVA